MNLLSSGPRRLIGSLLAMVMIVSFAVGCGEGENTAASQTDSLQTGNSDATDEPVNQPDDNPADDTDNPANDTEDPAGDTGDSAEGLPGDEWEGFAQPGAVLTVVGVAFDDVLNVRSIPGNDGEIVASVEPDGEVVATGQARLLPNSAWYEVSVVGAEATVNGWASVRYLAFEGATDDATAQFLDGNPSPTAASIEELATTVAEAFASTDGPISDVVQVTASSDGDEASLAEVTYDVIGLGDDAVVGYRLHVFANNDAGTFTLKSIERTVLCGRGLSGELCS